MKKLFLLVPLLFAKGPSFLDYTTLPPQFTMEFSNIIECEIAKPSKAVDNKLYYLEANGTSYMKAYFKQSALIPGAPLRFKDTPVWWFLVPDPDHDNLYTARVYSVKWKEWALVAVNVGPLRRDLVARYYAYFTVPPAPAPPTKVPVGNPPDGAPMQWFYTSGSNASNGSAASTSLPGYFAMFANPVKGPDGKLYKPPYSLVGGGAGAQHQAYGQLVYGKFNLSPNLTPASFTPPSDYKQIGMSEKGASISTSQINCTVCHESGIQLFEPTTHTAPCPTNS